MSLSLSGGGCGRGSRGGHPCHSFIFPLWRRWFLVSFPRRWQPLCHAPAHGLPTDRRLSYVLFFLIIFFPPYITWAASSTSAACPSSRWNLSMKMNILMSSSSTADFPSRWPVIGPVCDWLAEWMHGVAADIHISCHVTVATVHS